MYNQNGKRDRVTFEIVEHLGVLMEYDTGWNKELNLVSWNDRTPKYDIRDWDAEHKKMSRGITLRKEEMDRLIDIYSSGDTEEN